MKLTRLPEKSDLDVYLEEGRYVCDANANLDVLGWWKGERWRFPILSRLASDVLAIPVTTVASESTFSAGGRIIDDMRASMSVETVQMLLCGNDWIRNLHGLKNKSRVSKIYLLLVVYFGSSFYLARSCNFLVFIL